MRDLYYAPSGRAPLTGVVFGLLGGSLAGAALAFVYAYLILYIPLVGYVSFLLAAGFGALTGLAAGYSLRHGSVRAPAVGYLVGGVVGVPALYLSWVAWTYALLHREGVPAPLADVLFRPSVLWALIVRVNEVGAWSIHGVTPTGIVLWAFWAGEALLVLVPAVIAAGSTLTPPFCEVCERWCEERKGVRRSGVAAREELVRRLEAKDWSWIGTCGGGAAEAHLSYDLHVCPACGEMHTLSVNQVTTTQQKGKPVRNTAALLQYLLITRLDAAAISAAPPT